MKPTAPEEKLLYQRARFALPPPGLAIIGAFLTGFGLLGWLAIIDSNLEDRRFTGLYISGLLAVVLLGTFSVAYGYWRQPVFRFYENYLLVDGSIPHRIEYSRIVAVHVESLSYPHSFIFPLDELTVAYDDDCDRTQSLCFFVFGTNVQRLRLNRIRGYLSSRIDYSRLSESDVH